MSTQTITVDTAHTRSAELVDGIVVLTDSGNPDITSLMTFTDGDTTPSVALGTKFRTDNSAATNITDFDNTKGDGHRIIIYFGDDDTTLIHNASLIDLEGSIDRSFNTGDIFELLSVDGVWYGWNARIN